MVLVVFALIAGAIWGMRAFRGDPELEAARVQVDDFPLWCSACRTESRVPTAETDLVPRQGDALQCPKCKKFAASWGPPTTVGDVTMP